jgi:hypothetical protein
MAEPVTVVVQATPNPNAVKLTLNRAVAAQGTTYRDATLDAPAWAKQVLAVAGLTQVFALQSFISVNKTPEVPWEAICPQIEQILREAFA